MTGEAKMNGSKVEKIAIRVVLVAILGLQGVQVNSSSGVMARLDVLDERVQTITSRFERIEDLSGRVAAIEASRFTAEQGMEMWREIATLKARLPESFPPAETLKCLDRLERQVIAIDERVRALEKK